MSMKGIMTGFFILALGMPVSAIADYIQGLPCWSKDRWFFKYNAEISGGDITPFIRVQKLNNINKRYRVYKNVEQAGRDAAKVCRDEMSIQTFMRQYDTVKMKPYQFSGPGDKIRD